MIPLDSAARREHALAALGQDWNALLNHDGAERSDPQWCGGVLLEALARVACEADCDTRRCRVLIYGKNPLSNWMLRALDVQQYEALIVRTGTEDLPIRPGLTIQVFAHLDEISKEAVDCILVTALDPLISAQHMTEMCSHFSGRPVIAVDESLRDTAEHQRKTIMAARFDALRDYIARESRPVVVFVASNVYFNQLRMSRTLQARGWATVALSLHYAKGAHQQDYFDQSFHIDLDILLSRLAKLVGAVVHTQGWLNAYHIPVLIDAFRPDSVRHIVELMDVQSFFFPDGDAASMAPAIIQCWGENALEHIALQKRCERYLVAHAEGLVFTGGKTHQETLWPQDPASERFCNFASYPLQDFFTQTTALPTPPGVGESWRMVFAGGIPPCDERHPHTLFGDAQILPVIKRLLTQNICVDVYNNPTMIPERRLAALYPDYVALAQRDSRFNFGFGAYPWELAGQINDCHFGLMLYDFEGVMVGDLHFKAIIPSKFFQYLEAGLPVLVSDRFTSVCELVERYGIGLTVSSEGIDQLDGQLRSLDYRQLRENVLAARAALSMEAQIPRLEKLYRR